MPARCWAAFLVSRLVVLAAGVAGAEFTHRIPGWQVLDPERLSSRLGSVGNVLAAPAFRWDSIHYVEIAEHGYTTVGLTVLFPLYSVLIRGLTLIVVSPVIAGVLISLIAFALGLVLVHRITSEAIGSRAADAAVLLISFSPLSFVFSAVYTGSLLFALAAVSLYLARGGKFVLACIAAAAAALTHIQGVLLVAPLAFIYWDRRGRPRAPRKFWSPSLLALTLPVLALAALSAYMHAEGWSWLAQITSQNAQQAGRALVGPPLVVFDTVKDIVVGVAPGVSPPTSLLAPRAQNSLYLVVLLIAMGGLVSAWRRLPKEYALYAALALIVCTSSAVATEPLKGFDRYALSIFPLWIGAAAWFEERRLMPVVLMASATMLAIYTFEFARWASVF